MTTRKAAVLFFSQVTFLFSVIQSQAGAAVGGGVVDTPIRLAKGSGWVKINSQSIKMGDAPQTCSITASASVSLPNTNGGVYALGMGLDQSLPETTKACIRSSKLGRGTTSQEISDVCLFDGLTGSHIINLYARPMGKKSANAYVDRSGVIVHCSEDSVNGGVGITPASQTINIINSIGATQTFYVGLNNGTFAPYSQSFWEGQGCQFNTGNPYSCSFSLASPGTQTFSVSQGVNIAISAGIPVWSTCGGGSGLTMAELNLNPNPSGQDNYDVSLVNGFNYPVSVTPLSSPGVPAPASTAISVTSLTGNSNTAGVFPAGMDICVKADNPPQGSGCPYKSYPNEAHSGTQYNPSPVCVAVQPISNPTVPIYNVTFGNP